MPTCRRGSSLVEIAVASAVGFLLLAIVVGAHAREGRRHAFDDAELTLVQGVLRFRMELERDLGHLALDASGDVEAAYTATYPVVADQTADGSATLDVLTFQPDVTDPGQFGGTTHRVHWEFNVREGLVRRDGTALPGFQARRVQFELQDVPLTMGRAAFPTKSEERSSQVRVLRVEIVTATGQGRVARGPLSSVGVLPVVFAVPFVEPALRLRHADWNPGLADILLTPPEEEGTGATAEPLAAPTDAATVD